MKITIVTETFPPEVNGVAMTFGQLAQSLGERGHAVTVCRPRREDLVRLMKKTAAAVPAYADLLVRGVPIPGYPMLRLGLPARRMLRQHWRADPPDLVHVVTEGPLGASAVTAARQLGLAVTSSFHTNFHAYTQHYGFPVLRRAAVAWLRRIHNRTLHTFAPTVELCDELRALGFANLKVLSRGVNTRQFSPAHRSETIRAKWRAGLDDPVVLHAGRMAEEKNYPLLLQAFAAMKVANPRCHFVLVGDGPMRATLERDHPDFHFGGFMSRDELARLYASADIYIHPSLTETFGNVLTEAMASGLAVAAFDYAAGRQFIRHRRNGLSVPCSNPAALIQAAVMLATRPALRQHLRSAARNAVIEQSWDNVVDRFAADLIDIVQQHRAGSPSTVRSPFEADPTGAPRLVRR